MHVVINSDCSKIPAEAKLLSSEGTLILNFFVSLGYDPCDPPLADLLRLYHQLEGDWLVLSPVHWQATHNDAMIVATGKDLHLQEREAKAWFNLFSDYLAAEDMPLYYHNAELWLICNKKKHSLNAKPAHQLLHQSLMPELSQLHPALYWQKFITESQMFFASLPNHSSLNGVWIWGGAKLDNKNKTSVCVDEDNAAIARICSANVTLYNPSVTLKSYQVLLISDLSVLSEQHQEELKNIPAHWYWNNAAYTSSKSNWLTCLWRNLIHAH